MRILGFDDPHSYTTFHSLVIKGLLLAAFMNVLRGGMLVIVGVSGATLFINCGFWPLILRLTYGLQRSNLFENRKTIITAGLTLVLAAFTPRHLDLKEIVTTLLSKSE